MDIYAACCLEKEQICGPYKRSKIPFTGVFKVGDLTSDVHQHLVQLKLLKSFKKTDVNELTLIENRKGQAFQPNDVICAFHRYEIIAQLFFNNKKGMVVTVK